MNKKTNKGVLIAVILASLLVISYFAFQYFKDISSSESSVYQSLTVFYDDGTNQIFSPQNFPSLSVVDANSGKVVSTIQVSLYAKSTFTGSIASYSVTGAFTWQLKQGSTVLQTYNMPLKPLNEPVSSGQTITLASSTLTSADLESMYSYVHGYTYTIVMTVSNLQMTLYFADGSTATKTATVSPLSWQFNYVSNYYFSSLTITWGLDIN